MAMGSQWLVVPVLLKVAPVFIVLLHSPPAMHACDCYRAAPKCSDNVFFLDPARVSAFRGPRKGLGFRFGVKGLVLAGEPS